MIFTLSVTIVITSPRWPAKKTLRGEKTHTHTFWPAKKCSEGKIFSNQKVRSDVEKTIQLSDMIWTMNEARPLSWG